VATVLLLNGISQEKEAQHVENHMRDIFWGVSEAIGKEPIPI